MARAIEHLANAEFLDSNGEAGLLGSCCIFSVVGNYNLYKAQLIIWFQLRFHVTINHMPLITSASQLTLKFIYILKDLMLLTLS